MSESDNLLEKIKQKRARSTVPERKDSLIPQTNPQQNISSDQDDNSDLETDTNSVENTIAQLTEELSSYPPTIRRSAIVIEQQIEKELKQFCDDNKITIELFLEAAWQVSQNSPLRTAILNEAQIRYRKRKEVGRLKRLITQLKKLKS